MVGGVRWGLLEGHIVLHVHASCMNVSMRGALGLFSKRGGHAWWRIFKSYGITRR